MAQTRKIRGIESHEALDQKTYFRDVRPLGLKLKDVFKNTSYINAFIGSLAFSLFIFPGIYHFVLIFSLFFFFIHILCSKGQRLPFRLPKGAKSLDYGDPIPGRRKFNKAGGTFLLGNEWRNNYELWLANKDILTHMLIFGTTGSGKTESLVSLAFNAIAMGSGLFYIDPKAAPKLAFQIYVLSRICGRDDDYRVLNYGTGSKTLEKNTPKRMSNTQNPFAFGSASSLTQLLVSLIPSSEGGNAIFQQNAQTLITALMMGLVELRDKGIQNLDITVVRDYATLNKYVELAQRKDLSKGTLDALKSFLTSVTWQEGKPLDRQPKSLPEQFGYARMYFSLSLQSFADSYGHIYASPMGEIDMLDVIMHRRIMVTMLPSLEKAPQELQNLGKIALSAVRNAIAVGLGDKVEGSAADVLESLPTDAPTPFLTIVDEYAAIPTEGFAEILTQGRGLGVSAIVASQDYDGITKADEKGAGQIVANTKVKLCMTLEDPKSTWDLFKAIAAESTVMQTQGFQKNEGQIVDSGYKDQMSTSISSVSRIHIQDLQEQIEGEFHAFFKGDIVRGNVFYANPPLKSKTQLRITQMLRVSAPARMSMEQKYGEVKSLVERFTAIIKNPEKHQARIKEFEIQDEGLKSVLKLLRIKMKDRIKRTLIAFMTWDNISTTSIRRTHKQKAEKVEEARQVQKENSDFDDDFFKNEEARSQSQGEEKTTSEDENLEKNTENLIKSKFGENLHDERAKDDYYAVERKFNADSEDAAKKAISTADKVKEEIKGYPPDPQPDTTPDDLAVNIDALIEESFGGNQKT